MLFSGGLASFEVGRRAIKRYGRENARFWFFDTKIEDETLYSFIKSCASFLDVEIEIYTDGRNPWEVFKDERFIGNSRVPLCNRVLKREYLERTLKQEYPDKNCVLLLGYQYFEQARMEKTKNRWNENGYEVSFLLDEPPFLNHADLVEIAKSNNLQIPQLYDLGFNHNNCGGACVQAGIGQWARLLELFPERYLWHEEQEENIRKYLNKDVAILRDRTGGTTKPLTLRELRIRLNGKYSDTN